MPFIDSIPGVSQLKATVQLAVGDNEGAKRTTVNFVRECPGVAQLTSIVQLVTGDTKGALETQKRCIGTVNNVVNGVPLAGHVKGILHHVVGDHRGRNQALNGATRSTVVALSGIAAARVSEGISAIHAAIAAGAIYDFAASLISLEAQGIIAAFKDAFDNPSMGAILNIVAIPVGDSLAGYYGGKIGYEIKPKISVIMKLINKAKNWTGLLHCKASRNAVIEVACNISTSLFKINLIKCVTLKYETDGKLRQVADENNWRPKETSNHYYPTVIRQEYFPARITTGDCYTDERVIFFEKENASRYNLGVQDRLVPELVRQSKRPNQLERTEQLHKQKPQGHLREQYKGMDKTTLDTLTGLLRRYKVDPNRDLNRNPELKTVINQLLECAWLFFNMPEKIPYTIANQLNNERQGLYHSFIRHIHQWREVISFDNTLINRISPLMPEIEKLTGMVDDTKREKARDEFVEARSRLKSQCPGKFYDVHAAFIVIQMSLHAFIQEKLLSHNYLVKTVKDNGKENLYFKVMTKKGNLKVMVVCVSPPQLETTKPITELITVFFIPWTQKTKISNTVFYRHKPSKRVSAESFIYQGYY